METEYIVLVDKDGKHGEKTTFFDIDSLLTNKLEGIPVENLKKCLSEVFDDNGKAVRHDFTDAKNIKHDNIRHISSGDRRKKDGVTIFFYTVEESKEKIFYIFAIGQHKTNTSYKLCYHWQDQNDVYDKNKTVNLE